MGFWVKDIEFMVFDSPSHSSTFEARYRILKDMLPITGVTILSQNLLKSLDDIDKIMTHIVSHGGEGIILRSPTHFHYTGTILYKGNQTETSVYH